MATRIWSGKVKFFNEQKAYGFITDNETKKDTFFHVTGLLDSVTANDLVEYVIEEGTRGPKAIDICLIKEKGKTKDS